nr:EOG090X0C5Y [Megafenestra aurita]
MVLQPPLLRFSANTCFSGVLPIMAPSFNLSPLVNKSELLQIMLNLGVSIHKWEKKDVHSWIMTLDLKKNIFPILQFLTDQGFSNESLGKFLTKNPYIFKTSPEELEARTQYLLSKKFDSNMIHRIVSRNPMWYQFSVDNIDTRLGFFQQTFQLSGNELRLLACKEPRLITRKFDDIKIVNFSFREEMGFESFQIKNLLLLKPKLWIMNREMLVDRFDYLHNVMKLDHESIMRFPGVLSCRNFKIKQRHEFLIHLNRAQSNPKLPNYISPLDIVKDSDANFAVYTAKSSIQLFNDFCKTL